MPFSDAGQKIQELLFSIIKTAYNLRDTTDKIKEDASFEVSQEVVDTITVFTTQGLMKNTYNVDLTIGKIKQLERQYRLSNKTEDTEFQSTHQVDTTHRPGL